MKYLKTYENFNDKLFESSNEWLDTYLQKMGATKEDVNDIFVDLTDSGYTVEYSLKYKDKLGRVRGKKTTNYEIPILKIDLENKKTRYVGGSIKMKNLKYIEDLYHSLSRFSEMYKGNLSKLTYELHSNAAMTINCYFEAEEDDVMPFIPFEDMADAIKSSLRNTYGDKIDLMVKSESNKELRLDVDILPYPDDEDKLIDKLQDELKNSDKDWATNYDQVESFRSSIIRILQSDLSKRFNMKLLLTHKNDPVWNRRGALDGIYTYEYTPVPDTEGPIVKLFDFSITPESRHHKYSIKKGFFRKKTIELEIYDRIEIILRLI